MKKFTLEDFIRAAKNKYGDKYTYEKVNYINSRTPIVITCPIHGDFTMLPRTFLYDGQGCRQCGIIRRVENSKDTLEDFIKKANLVHHNKYSYNNAIYKGSHSLITITCPIHGDFSQKAYSHLGGHECPKCGNFGKHINKIKKLGVFIAEARDIHGSKYDYSQFNYIGNHIASKIICPEHGPFYQTPLVHLHGGSCPICMGSRGEQIIWQWLKEHNIKFTFQKTFSQCKNKHLLPFDFYLPEYNIVIEYQGQQHFEYIPFFDKNYQNFTIRQERDKIKKDFCLSNDIIFMPILYNQHIINILEEWLL